MCPAALTNDRTHEVATSDLKERSTCFKDANLAKHLRNQSRDARLPSSRISIEDHVIRFISRRKAEILSASLQPQVFEK